MGARRLGQDEQYLTVREILSEASTLADGILSGERSDFCRFGYATLGLDNMEVKQIIWYQFQGRITFFFVLLVISVV